MIQISHEIKSEHGIHARPAGVLVKMVSGYESSVIVKTGGKQANANKLFAIMGLCAQMGDVLDITIEGADEEKAAAGLKEFLENNL